MPLTVRDKSAIKIEVRDILPPPTLTLRGGGFLGSAKRAHLSSLLFYGCLYTGSGVIGEYESILTSLLWIASCISTLRSSTSAAVHMGVVVRVHTTEWCLLSASYIT